MDESWRMQMGMTTKPSIPRRNSIAEGSGRAAFGHSDNLDPGDFSDVFGGPPRSVLRRQFSGHLSRSTLFYEEIFGSPDNVCQAKSGRNLPEFRIPAPTGVSRRREGFYDDIFGSDEDIRRSRSRSKSMSNSKSTPSSVLSSEELSPLRPAPHDVAFPMFASKLRPITVSNGRNWSTMMPEGQPRQRRMPASSCDWPSYTGNQFVENENTQNSRSPYFGFSRQVPSPETISLEPDSSGSVKVSMDDLELNSPSSVVSSLCQVPDVKASRVEGMMLDEQEVELDEEEEEEEEEVMSSSYVIEINSDHGERTGGSLAIDEAIAWVKEKFQTQSSGNNWDIRKQGKEESADAEESPSSHEFLDGGEDGHASMQSQMETEPSKWPTEEKQELDKDVEMELLDEDIRLWSSGKATNIGLLLSTLHHILWPNSGWSAISLTSLTESSHVKKAYQKARLCLHPDKLQQRGATISQKYVAEKAFSILQGAWAAFISQGIYL